MSSDTHSSDRVDKKPIIVVVDDDPQVLSAIKHDLVANYGAEYRVHAAPGGHEGLDLTQRLKQRGDRVALFVVDQRMPELEGTELLARTRLIYPAARKVLLTAYADTSAAIAAINEVDLDHYLLKPWDPPEDKLYPVLDDLLGDWQANAPATFEGIRIVGRRYSKAAHDTKDWLRRNQVPYRWLDLDRDREARALLDSSAADPDETPVVFFADGEVMVSPDLGALAAKVGKTTTVDERMFDLVIIGAGPAGLGAAVYGASEGLDCALIEKYSTGGQAGTSSRIENYLGFPNGLSGEDLARRATAQVERFGCEVLCPIAVKRIETDDLYRYVTLDDGSCLASRALLIASGMTTRRLEKPGCEELTGRGVYYGAALTESEAVRGEHAMVVGAANSAGQAALELSRHADRVSILCRGPAIEAKMSDYLVKQIERTPNIDIFVETEVARVEGDDHLEKVVVLDKTSGMERSIATAALFIFVGTAPHSKIVEDVVELDEKGFVFTGPDLIRQGRRPLGWPFERDPYPLETSVPGIFAAGDIQHGAVRRVASAVGAGAIAVTLVHQYLSEA